MFNNLRVSCAKKTQLSKLSCFDSIQKYVNTVLIFGSWWLSLFKKISYFWDCDLCDTFSTYFMQKNIKVSSFCAIHKKDNFSVKTRTKLLSHPWKTWAECSVWPPLREGGEHRVDGGGGSCWHTRFETREIQTLSEYSILSPKGEKR